IGRGGACQGEPSEQNERVADFHGACSCGADRATLPPFLSSMLRRSIRVDYLENVTVGIAKEKPCEWGWPLRLHEGRSVGREATLQGVELGAGEGEGDMPTELRLERRGGKVGHLDKVQFLSRRDFQPGGWPADVSRPVNRAPAERLREERQRGWNMA